MTAHPTVTIALDWAANAHHTGICVAQRRGEFDREGVQVVIRPAEAARYPAQVALAGDADLVVAFAGTVIEARDAGLPLVSVAALSRQHWSSLVARRDSGLHRPADFSGQRYASFGHPALERAVIAAMLAHDGAADTAFDLRAVRFADPAHLGGEFDFLWIYDDIEGVDATAHGIELAAFSPADYGVPQYSAPTLCATDGLLADPVRRDAGRRVMAALRRGYALAARDPDGAVADLVALAPAIGGLYYDQAAIAAQSQRFLSAHHPAPDNMAWGRHDAAEWAPFATFLWERGALRQPPDVARLYSNDLLA